MRTVKYYLRVSVAAFLAAIACPSCNDTWDDHYDVQGSLASGNTGASLWENLNTDTELAPFNRVLKACGYDEILNSPQMYTVWAPVITDEEADEWIRIYEADNAAHRVKEQNTTIKEFVMNHIALYNHPINSQTSDTVIMRNGKYMMLTSNAINQNVDITDVRIPSKNGMLYKIVKPIPYFRNVWDAIQADSVGEHALDSVAHFFAQFEEETLDLLASVPGDLDSDGNQHYVDSVINRQNTFFSDVSPINYYYRRAYIDSEDSSYYFLAPTNKVWKEKVEEYKKYFICAHDYRNVASTKLQHVRDSLVDLYAKTALIESCFFNALRQSDPTMQDSICSTIWSGSSVKDYNGAYKFDAPFAAGGIFGGASYEECSNGRLYKADDWKVSPEKTFIQPIKIEAEDNKYYTVADEKKVLVTAETSNNEEFKVSGAGYIVVTDITTTGSWYNPSITFDIPNTLSNCPYDVKVVFATRLANTELSQDTLDRQVTIGLNYYQNETTGFKKNPDEYLKNQEVKGMKMDTVTVTEKKGPLSLKVCNFMGEDTEHVQLTISSRFRRSNTTYSPNLAIDCIILEPRLEEKEGNN